MSLQRKVRVRFAPSPTGGLHLGGVRTALFNYLFARQHHGDFILRVEDTDQTRFVAGAEEYISECLSWCGMTPDESPENPGPYGPYRQSERKPSYRQYAEQLVDAGYAYYAFDTAGELDEQRKIQPNFRYSHENRLSLRNSLNLSPEETETLLRANTSHTIRIKMPIDETVYFDDLIRGRVSFDTNLVDDKVLLKADGMPTYHLAVVVDDKAMAISHIFRGEEWLPSAPVHILLWDYLGWKAEMPQWAHLPLILKPDGNGKLSKRDGDRLGFPVYAMNWADAKSGDVVKGFREMGFLPQAFVNMLALLGWNDGTEKEIFSMDELIDKFAIERISKAGAKFDFEKAKWFNHEWIKQATNDQLLSQIKTIVAEHSEKNVSDNYLEAVLSLVKERLTFIEDFWSQASFFIDRPTSYDLDAVKPKWNIEKTSFFESLSKDFDKLETWEASEIEKFFKERVSGSGMKVGELMMPFRIMLVGGKFGPDVFNIVQILGRDEVVARIALVLPQLA